MDQTYEILADIIKDVMPDSEGYIFQPKAEFENFYSFILVVDSNSKNSAIIKDNKILTIIQAALNLSKSTLTKKVEIEVEVFNESD